jgi:hypothetical protein
MEVKARVTPLGWIKGYLRLDAKGRDILAKEGEEPLPSQVWAKDALGRVPQGAALIAQGLVALPFDRNLALANIGAGTVRVFGTFLPELPNHPVYEGVRRGGLYATNTVPIAVGALNPMGPMNISLITGAALLTLSEATQRVVYWVHFRRARDASEPAPYYQPELPIEEWDQFGESGALKSSEESPSDVSAPSRVSRARAWFTRGRARDVEESLPKDIEGGGDPRADG